MPGGRPPLPTALKEARGNPGKRPLNKSEPQFTTDGLTCPRWLNLEARREWRRAAKLLKDQRVVTAADRGALAAYCVSYARWQQAERILDEGGLSQTVPIVSKKGDVIGEKQVARPEVMIAQQYQRLMMGAAARLGMDPSSRSKVSVIKSEVKNPILRMVQGGREKQTGS
jgi:P27 family predicted phage terminase small subunit